MNRLVVVAAAAAFTALIVWGLWPRGAAGTDEDKIRAVIAAMTEATGERKVGDVMKHFSDSYRGELGDKQGVHGYALATFFRSQTIIAVASGVEVAVDGDTADVSLRLSLARAPGEGEANDVFGSHVIDATFAKEDGAWKVRSAKRLR